MTNPTREQLLSEDRLSMETGGPLSEKTYVPGNRIQFVTEDDRTMFEVAIGNDGRSLEIRAVESCKVAGKVHVARLLVRPVVSNVVVISTVPYEQ